MSKKEFHDHYSIEYLHPGMSSTSQKKKRFILPLLFLLILVALGFFLWKQGYIDQFTQKEKVADEISQTTDVVVDNKPPVPANESKTQAIKVARPLQKVKHTDYSNQSGEEIFVDKCTYCHGKNGQGNLKELYPKLQGQNSAYLLLQLKRMRDGKRLNVNPAMFKIISKMNDKTLTRIAAYISQIPTPENTLATEKEQLLSDKLQNLKDQLSTEKQKISKLETQLKENLEISQQFSNLYKNAVKNINQDDKAFLKVVETEKMRLSKISVKKSTEDKANEDSTTVESVKQVTATNSSTGANSTVEISTGNQVDQIVSAMKNNITSYKPLNNKQTSGKRLYVDLNNVAQKSVNLQKKINQLVSEKDIPKTSFTKALKKEDKVRRNSVRSVVVRKGETLWSIAKRAYGSGFKYPKILKANPSIKKGRNVRLYVGQVIRVPK